MAAESEDWAAVGGQPLPRLVHGTAIRVPGAGTRSSGRPTGGAALEARPSYDHHLDDTRQLRGSDLSGGVFGSGRWGALGRWLYQSVRQETDTVGKQSLSRGLTKDRTVPSNPEMVKESAEETSPIWQRKTQSTQLILKRTLV